MSSRKKFDVFLSHNSIDKPWVIKLKKSLEDFGIKVWLDKDEIRPGDIFAEELEKGIEESNSLALVISPEALKSGWVKNEYYRALSLATSSDMQLIPIILRKAEIPGFLRDRNWIDFQDESKFKESLEQLIWGITNEKPSNKIDIGIAPDFEEIIGRENELDQWVSLLANDKIKVFFMSGLAGIGKTSLTYKLVNLVEKNYDFVIWKSLFNTPPLEEILKSILCFILKSDVTDIFDDTKKLKDFFMSELKRKKCLIVFDNFDALLTVEGKTIEFKKQFTDYSELLDEVCFRNHKSQILINSRTIPNLTGSLNDKGTKVIVRDLRGLDDLDSKELFIKNKLSSDSLSAWNNLLKMCGGHPATIEIIAKQIKEDFLGNISKFLESKGKDISIGFHESIADQIPKMSKKELEVVYWLAINRSFVTFNDLFMDIKSFDSKEDLATTLQSLQKRIPIIINNNSYTIQAIYIEFFSEKLVEQLIKEVKKISTSIQDSNTKNRDKLTINTQIDNIYFLTNFPLLKTTIKEHIRQGQEQFLLKPVLEGLMKFFNSKEKFEKMLVNIAEKLKEIPKTNIGYSVGNIINLLLLTKNEIKDLDFSGMPITHAYLRGKILNNVNFHESEIINSVFTDTFGLILSMAFSKDGNVLATGSGNSDIQLWEMPEEKQIRSLIGHESWVVSLDFSPDNKKLASGGNDHKIFIWDLTNGKHSSPLIGHEESVRSVCFNHDGKYLASGSEDKTIRIWNVETGENVNTFRTDNPVRTVKFHPKKNVLVSGGNNPKIQIWDIDSGSWIDNMPGHEEWIRSLVFSSDGKMLASSSSDTTIKIWDFDDGKCKSTLKGHDRPVMVIVFGADANTLISSSNDKTIRIWDIKNGDSQVLTGHKNWVRALGYNSQQNIIASGSDDLTIKLWDPTDRECISTLNAYINPIWSIDFNEQLNLLATGGNDGVQIWDPTKEEIIRKLLGHEQRVWSVAFSPSGKNIVSGSDDFTAKIWDIDSEKCLCDLDNQHTKRIWSVDYSPKGDLIVSAGEDKVCIWNAVNGQYIDDLQKGISCIHVAKFDPTGKYLAIGGEDSLIRLWDLNLRKFTSVLEGHNNWIFDIQFTPNGEKIISSAGDNLIKKWDIQTKIFLDFIGHTDKINSIAYNQNKNIIASGSADKTIRLWDFESGEQIETTPEQEGCIWGVCFIPEENLLASCCEDGNIKFWEVNGLKWVKTLSKRKPYECLNITGIKGISEAQKLNLIRLGAIDYDRV